MGHLKKTELKNHLQNSVQILKRTLSYTSYCSFILAMLFFYHVGDTQGLVRARSTHSVVRGAGRSMNLMRIGFKSRRKDLYEDLMEGFADLELTHPALKGLLLSAVPSTPLSDEDLSDYRDQLERLDHTTGVFSSPEDFSLAFDYWLARLAKLTTTSSAGFYTPPFLAQLMVDLIRPEPGMSIYDPTAGTGSLLIGAANYIMQQGGSLETTTFTGREKSPDIWAIGNMNMIVHQMPNFTLEQGDTLESPKTLLGTFDLVVQNLPLPPDSANRGQIRKLNGAFLRHSVEALKPDGRAAVLSAATVLQEEHQEFWRYIISRDWLEAVIKLPPKLLYGTKAPASILIFNKDKQPVRRAQVLFIQFPVDSILNARIEDLRDDVVQQVIQTFDGWQTSADFARIIPVSQIEEHNYSLNLWQYPELNTLPETFDINAALNRYRSAVQKRELAVERLFDGLEKLQYPVKGRK